MSPAWAEHYSRLGRDISRGVTGYMTGDILTSIVAGVVVFTSLAVLDVPYPLLWGPGWPSSISCLPSAERSLASHGAVRLTQSLQAGIVTAIVFLVYTQFENHVLNPVVMSRTVRVNPLLVFVSIIIGASIGGMDRWAVRGLRRRLAGHPGRDCHPGRREGSMGNARRRRPGADPRENRRPSCLTYPSWHCPWGRRSHGSNPNPRLCRGA